MPVTAEVPLRPMDRKDCPGRDKRVIVHNRLAEALRIAARKSSIVAQRERLEPVNAPFTPALCTPAKNRQMACFVDYMDLFNAKAKVFRPH
jgi:hypothetical protein